MSAAQRAVIVAIDGPSGVGKSTVARGLAARLDLPYLETGAMYRAVGLKVLELGIDPGDERAVVEVASDLDLEIEAAPGGEVSIRLDGAPLGDRVRDDSVATATSRIAVYPGVRCRLVDLQRRFGHACGGVVEGRDIGTKVFPEARFKFFLEADPEERARRRIGEHAGRGVPTGDLEAVQAELAERDSRDAGRADSPLAKDESYHVLDTTHLTADEVVERMLAVVRAGLA